MSKVPSGGDTDGPSAAVVHDWRGQRAGQPLAAGPGQLLRKLSSSSPQSPRLQSEMIIEPW